ncbi:DUF5813 family protein [Halorussus amylolyticus]|uniref:DUF5813 family protein n=1 Tax=Halorussus amylolyticus TaxID=1126242 RepID=UPI00138EFB5C|nr:DUF5813 family protein [Halorussus amylolyticus]
MTAENIDRAFRQHPAFEKTDDSEYETTTTPFEGVVTAEDDESASDGRDYRVVVRTPVLDAVVEGETVAEVVETGWFETLELRLSDAHTVVETDAASPPEIEREGDEVVVTVEFERADPERAAEDAKAVVDYVEGTWVQGIIPGYDYRDPAASLMERATQNYDEDDSGGHGDSPSGGPPL